ncbi:MAG: autotransporter domain-containing protein [Pseudomonadota bacterium]|nr:autotransporter domain-containing protein [Pseudomonadota bacterium]
MKNKLLFTTALVAMVSASNAYAERVVINQEDINNEIWGGEEEYSVFSHNFEESKMNNDDILIDNVRVSVIDRDYEIKDGQRLEMQQGRLDALGKGDGSTHSFKMSGGEVILNGSENIEDDYGIFGNGIKISGGSIILNNSGLTDDGTDKVLQDGREYPASSIDISDGTIVMNSIGEGSSWLDSHGHVEYQKDENGKFIYVDENGNRVTDEEYEAAHGAIMTDPVEIEGSREGGEINISGGKIIVNGGQNKITENLQGVNVWAAKDINLSGGELEITSGSNLVTVITPENMKKSTINLTDDGTINLAGGLLANVSGNGNLNVKSSSALVDGNVSGSNLTFEADHSLSKAFSGTIGDLASLNVNKGTLTYDKQTGKISNLNVTGGLDIGTNTVNATNVDFKDNSSLALRVAATNNYGKINADNITIGKDTTMKVTLDNGVVGNGENTDLKFLNGKVTGSFTNKIAENSRYDIKWNEDGSLNITGTATASDVVVDAGGSINNAKTAEAWDSITSSTTASAGAKAVASVLGDLSQNATTAAGQKAYVDALTAVAPEVAPMVQKTQTETANQVFGAVSTRLTGGSISTGSEGMSSGDSNLDAAVWVQGMFNKSKLDDTSKSKGFDADSNGVALGIEKFINKDVKVGAGYAYTNTDIDGFMRSTDVDTHTAIVYGEYKPSNWYVNGIATYGWSDYSEDKNVAGVGVKADYDVETFGLQAMTGYDMQVKGFSITPEAGLRYVHIKQDAYKDSADQHVSANDSDVLTGVIGAKVSKNFELSNGMNIKPEARIAATYDLFNDDVNSVVTLANGSAYAVEGEALDRFGMEFGAGVTAEVNSQVELSLGYEGKFREDYQDHTGLINAKYKF